MRVIHNLGWYFPDTTGGTEVYVSQLVAELRKLGVEGVIAAARDGFEEDTYFHEGVSVFRYPVYPDPSQSQLRGVIPYGGFEQFALWLAKQNADVYHQHSVVGGCGVHHLIKAKELGLQTVLTVHLPGMICMRGSMMLYGERPCDGRVDDVRCGVCWGMSKGLPLPIAAIAGRIPGFLSRIFEGKRGSLSTTLATSAIVESQKANLHKISRVADRTVAISDWLYEALIANGFSKDHLLLCPSGGPSDEISATSTPRHRTSERRLSIGFAGRVAMVKGVELLVRAVLKVPVEIPVELNIHGIPAGPDERSYEEKVRQLAHSDPRIQIHPPLAPNQILEAMKCFDVIAIPSQWLETGPLVALEAHAAGVPILASNLGGLKERVRDQIDGLLLPANDETAWTEAIIRLATEPELLERLRSGIRPIRTMADVAIDMSALYQTMNENRVACSAC